jgi:hypothetical protein
MSRSVTLEKRENWFKFCTSNFMPNTPAQKRLRDAKAIRKEKLKVEQEKAAVEIEKRELQAQQRLLEEQQGRLQELSRAAWARARYGFDPGPIPDSVMEGIVRTFRGAASARDKNSQF